MTTFHAPVDLKERSCLSLKILFVRRDTKFFFRGFGWSRLTLYDVWNPLTVRQASQSSVNFSLLNVAIAKLTCKRAAQPSPWHRTSPFTKLRRICAIFLHRLVMIFVSQLDNRRRENWYSYEKRVTLLSHRNSSCNDAVKIACVYKLRWSRVVRPSNFDCRRFPSYSLFDISRQLSA